MLEVLKGEPVFWYETGIRFALNTVSVGQRLIVAVQPIGDNNNHFWFDLTSTNNSIFEMNQLDEIRAILNLSSGEVQNQQNGNNNDQGSNEQ